MCLLIGAHRSIPNVMFIDMYLLYTVFFEEEEEVGTIFIINYAKKNNYSES